MARVLICEPHDDIYDLLELVVRRLGHEAVRFEGALDDELDVQAAVIEPAMPDGLRLAARLKAESVGVLFASILPAGREALELEPVAYLVKPFPLQMLERELQRALALPYCSTVAS